ncbi:Probable ATP-dependent DNA helicase YoaA [Durusdinium trenchii]|uniref:Probable ATP-dependent DNA helicase YoaA n=1 Tax=Durusdinium trenchii TaxID=1381693 RepID=A0ABP0R4U1_9DINO
MVYLDRIYTRSGDAGETALGDGTRVRKSHPRIVAYGGVDELNAAIGVAVAKSSVPDEMRQQLLAIQNDLFDVGADLCVPESDSADADSRLRVTEGQVGELEKWIDAYTAELEPLKSFVLPGGTEVAAALHLARAICRRVEIGVIRLADIESINRHAIIYLNRLSDLLFVMSRSANDQGGEMGLPPRHREGDPSALAILQLISGGVSGTQYPVEGDRILVGRHPNCQVVLQNGAVSRHHAQILNNHGTYYVEDCRSRNGTYLNGEAVEGRADLRDGDEIRLCDVTLQFVEHPSAMNLPQDVVAESKETVEFTESGDVPISVDESRIYLLSEEYAEPEFDSSTAIRRLASDDEATDHAGKPTVAPEVKLRAIIEITRALGRELEVDRLLPKMLATLFNIFPQAEQGFVLLRDPETQKLKVKATRARGGDVADSVAVSMTVVRHALQSREALLSENVLDDSRFKKSTALSKMQIRSMMCVPLLTQEEEGIGVIQIVTRDEKRAFTEEDLDLLISLAAQAALVIENARLHEEGLQRRELERDLEFATQVQLGFLPKVRPKVEGYEFADYYEAALRVGGDYFDYVELPDGRLAIAIGDVAGKGMPAALLMARLYSSTRFQLLTKPTIEKAVEGLNEEISSSGLGHRFITFLIMVLDPTSNELTIVNAGHLAPIRKRDDGSCELLARETSSMPLGIVPDLEYQSSTVQLDAGDLVLVYTDGPRRHRQNVLKSLTSVDFTTVRHRLGDVGAHRIGHRDNRRACRRVHEWGNLAGRYVPRGVVPSPGMTLTPREVLQSGGVIARRLPQFESRPQQLDMADAVHDAIARQEHLIVEAGTGVGKSFAYLIPAILSATDEAAAAGPRRKIVVSTQTISLQEQLIHRDIPFLNSVLPVEFSAVLVKGRSNYVSLRRLKGAFERSRSLFPDDEQMRQLSVLRQWGATTSDGSLADLDFRPYNTVWDEVRSEHGNCLGRGCPTYQDCLYYRARRRVWNADVLVVNHALFFADLALRREGASVLPDYDVVIMDEAHTVEDKLVTRLRYVIDALFDAIDVAQQKFKSANGRVRRPMNIENTVSSELNDLAMMIRDVATELEADEERIEMTAAADRLDGLAASLKNWLQQRLEDAVYWIETSSTQQRTIKLVSSPIDIGPVLREELFDRVKTVVLTSATLSVGEGGLRLLSSSNRVRLVLSEGMPDPGDDPKAYEEEVCRRIRHHVLETSGRAFVLFTSYRMLRNCAAQLNGWAVDHGLTLLCQGGELNRTLMLQRFQAAERGLLFGTESFWQGVDVPGDALQNVIITKLPFSVPDQPLLEARVERIREQGGNPFMDYQIPEAAIKLW